MSKTLYASINTLFTARALLKEIRECPIKPHVYMVLSNGMTVQEFAYHYVMGLRKKRTTKIIQQ